MKREHTLRRRLRSLKTLSEAVTAMKSLSAHHFRTARAALPAARVYRDGIDKVLGAIGVFQPETKTSAAAMLLVAADLGLCDGYNSRLAQAAIDYQAESGAQRVYCIGRRPMALLSRSNLDVSRLYHAPTSIAGLVDLLLDLVQDLFEDYLEGKFASLHVVSARFEGVGEFQPTRTQILPVNPPTDEATVKPSPYVSDRHLAAFAIREFLYIRLYQTLLDSLASEHATRLVDTEAAGEWLASRTSTTSRQLASIRREATTQEVLEIAIGSKRRREHAD